MVSNASADDNSLTLDPGQRASVLVEALPYIQAFAGRTVVAHSFAADIVLLRAVGVRPVVVHGGGPQIGAMLERLGKESEFRNGLRVTDAETLDVARMVLSGQVGRELVTAINHHTAVAVGLSGEDAGLILATQRDESLGFVGDVVDVNRTILDTLIGGGFVPVVSTIGADSHGQALNINADSAAIAVAAALGAEKIVYLTDVPGVLTDVDDPGSLLLIADGVISGGMIPKVEACLDAIEAGVGAAHILDGRIPHVLLLELLTDAGVGTKITRTEGSGT